MKIIALEAENIKYLKVVNIKPDGSLVVVGGDNAQGKTCVLDSIEYALHGAGSIPSKPIRDGEKKARVVVDLGDIRVIRTFTENGTRLVVKNKDGAVFPSPQAMLDKLVGELTFDPLEFSRMDGKKQANVLKQLVGLNFDSLNDEYNTIFNKRTEVNNRGKALKSQLDGIPEYDNLPDKEVQVSELIDKLEKANDRNRYNQSQRYELDLAEANLVNLEAEMVTLREKIKKSKQQITKLRSEVSSLSDVDVDKLHTQIRSAETTNIKIRERQKRNKLAEQVNGLREQFSQLTHKLEEIKWQKQNMLESAKFPIQGLALNENGVTFRDIPFDQCSAAQRIKISVAMGLAMNPKLKVLLIREGSLLDKKNLAMIAKIAQKADAQIWLERVSRGKECSVIIENGMIKEE
ncbi:MAG: AAA family ATPase [Candidatus Heimdallarchaeota archaeon]|nr:MAG: AAA family ATPase [Candidatus Heimdallarchaeota archaeon]